MSYLRDHWLGRQPLAWSFWVNLVVVRAVVIAAERFSQAPFVRPPELAVATTIAFFVAAHVVLQTWQVVGVLRACDRATKGQGAMLPVLGTQAGLVASGGLTLVSAFVAFQPMLMDPELTRAAQRLHEERESLYTLRVVDNGTRVELDGTIEFGVTNNLSALLAENHDVRAMVLNSGGGQIYEARGIARLIRERGLETIVFGTCKSSCTTAFMAGETRTLGPDGRLGFHQYQVEGALYPHNFVDLDAEQEKDRAFFRAQGVDPAFLRRVFDASHKDIWMPSRAELLEAGVVHRIADPPAER